MLVECSLLFFCFTIMIGFYMRFKHFFKAMLIGTSSGILAFAFCGYFLHNYICFSVFNFLMSAITGVPGVLLIILFKRFC